MAAKSANSCPHGWIALLSRTCLLTFLRSMFVLKKCFSNKRKSKAFFWLLFSWSTSFGSPQRSYHGDWQHGSTCVEQQNPRQQASCAQKAAFRQYEPPFNFSSSAPALISPLKVDSISDTRAVFVRMRIHPHEQRECFSGTVGKLIVSGHACSNTTSTWTSSPHLAPKPCSAKFKLTVELRSVNRFTPMNQFLMPIEAQGLTWVPGSVYFDTFILSRCYWQLPLHSSSEA